MGSPKKTDKGFEFYETPRTFTHYLFDALTRRGVQPLPGQLLFEPCVGSGAILAGATRGALPSTWVTNDLDPRWEAVYHFDACSDLAWLHAERSGSIDWTISNPPFSKALDIIEQALAFSRVGVAMHLRASIHEVLRTGPRRTWMRDHLPTGCLWLPRFAFQRSPTTGDWTTDSVTTCWLIWLKDPAAPQFIDYAPEWVLDALAAETLEFRVRMVRMDSLALRGKLPAHAGHAEESPAVRPEAGPGD